jgi:hypothetical protein
MSAPHRLSFFFATVTIFVTIAFPLFKNTASTRWSDGSCNQRREGQLRAATTVSPEVAFFRVRYGIGP